MQESIENIEQELLTMIAAGSEAAFSRLFQFYRNKLYSFIYRISGDRQLSEDVVQEVFLKIWQNRTGLNHIRGFDSYLFRMAHNFAINAIKKMAKEMASRDYMTHFSHEYTENMDALEFKEIQLTLSEAVGKLPKKQKEVFILSREYGFKQAEISRFLNITVPTVKSHITQAMHSIRKKCKNIYPIVKIYLLLVSVFLN